MATGIGPYSDQSVHFKHVAPEPKEYAVNRYDFEAWRHWDIVDRRLAANRFMLGDTYTLVDLAVWGWARMVPRILEDTAWENLPYLIRMVDEISARPAAQRAEALAKQHQFKTEVDDETRRALYPQNARLAAR